MLLVESTTGEDPIYYLHGLDLVAQSDTTTTEYFGYDGLGSVRQVFDAAGDPVMTQTFDPYGSRYEYAGPESVTSVGYTGEFEDGNGLLFLRARFYNPAFGRFLNMDPSRQEVNPYQYAASNPVMYVDPSGLKRIDCPVGEWDCEAVRSIRRLRSAFEASAERHNRLTTMDNDTFAALVATLIVGERRIGRVVEGERNMHIAENLVAWSGCVISGHFIQEAWESGDYDQVFDYLTNNSIPEINPIAAYASVGIGNVKIETAARLWRGQACNFNGDCTDIPPLNLEFENAFGMTMPIINPFGVQTDWGSCYEGICAEYMPTEIQSYQEIALQLLQRDMNIEYVSANLEAGAWRLVIEQFETADAYRLAVWHTFGGVTDGDIELLAQLRDIGHADWVLRNLPTALTVLFGE